MFPFAEFTRAPSAFGEEAEYEFPAAAKLVGTEELGQEAVAASQHRGSSTLNVIQLVMVSLTFLAVLAWIEVLFYAVRNPESQNVEYLLALEQADPARQQQMLQKVRANRHQQRTQLLYFALGVTGITVFVGFLSASLGWLRVRA